MKKPFLATSIVALMTALMPQAHAAFITGTVDFTGSATINGTGPLDATAFTGFSGVSVDFATGDYGGTAGSSATFKPFSFSPSSGPVAGLWTFTMGGTTYSFDLSTEITDSQGVPAGAPGLGVIQVSGTGTAHATGFADTPGSFVLHASGGTADLELAFGASETAIPPGVPETGNTLMLCGFALSGLGLVRRRLA